MGVNQWNYKISITSVETVFQTSTKFMEETVENAYKIEVKKCRNFHDWALIALKLENILCFII